MTGVEYGHRIDCRRAECTHAPYGTVIPIKAWGDGPIGPPIADPDCLVTTVVRTFTITYSDWTPRR